MRPEEFHFLLSPDGQAALAELTAAPPTPDSHMAVAAHWRERLGPERSQAALETALLRQRAARKFARAAEMFFTRAGLEQATAEPLAAHRAARFAAAGARGGRPGLRHRRRRAGPGRDRRGRGRR
ncbi:MAG: hypothetical protein IPH95_08320 [Candidatus Promineofilum sp.]|nr:hypothetical protein [Promineifilum sp.]